VHEQKTCPLVGVHCTARVIWALYLLHSGPTTWRCSLSNRFTRVVFISFITKVYLKRMYIVDWRRLCTVCGTLKINANLSILCDWEFLSPCMPFNVLAHFSHDVSSQRPAEFREAHRNIISCLFQVVLCSSCMHTATCVCTGSPAFTC